MTADRLDRPFASHYDEGGRLLRIAGDIGYRDVATFAALVKTLVATGGGRVDLSTVTHLPSSCVGAVATAAGRARATGVPFVVVAAAGSVADAVLSVVAVAHER